MREEFFLDFFFWIGKYYRILLIEVKYKQQQYKSQIQTATSEATTASKNLGISSTHASKHYYYYFEVISSFGSKYYLYMLRVFRKLIMILENVKNTPILIR